MADFCKQCSEELFGEDNKDLAALMLPEKYKDGYGAVAICEGCGDTVVDVNGKCIAVWCEKHGSNKNEQGATIVA